MIIEDRNEAKAMCEEITDGIKTKDKRSLAAVQLKLFKVESQLEINTSYDEHFQHKLHQL